MIALRAFILALSGAAILAAPSFAHRVHAGVTEISVNPRTGEMEIIHRVFAHDLVMALGYDEMDAEDFFASPEGQNEIRAYVSEAFRMADGTGLMYAPQYVGAEVDGEFGWIYFLSDRLPDPAEGFVVDNDILADHFDDQVMMTNLRFESRVRTAMHGPGQRGPARVRFAP